MLARRGGFFNIGVDGQIYAGAIATTGFAFLAAGTFAGVEEAQRALCPSYRTVEPDPMKESDHTTECCTFAS